MNIGSSKEEHKHLAPSANANFSVLENLLSSRHSCRGFLPHAVDRNTIVKILEMAQRTASWCNSQPWQVVVTSGEGTERFREALHKYAAGQTTFAPDLSFPRQYSGVYMERRRNCAAQLYGSLGIASGDRATSSAQTLENFRLFGAPHAAIITTDEALGVYGAIDCGAYVSNLMLSAWSLGVASIAQAALAAHSGFIREYFGVSKDRNVVCGISFGYEDRAHPANSFRTSRARIEDSVVWKDE